MVLADFLSKYPRTKSFLKNNPGMTLDRALIWTEEKLERSSKREKNLTKSESLCDNES